MILLVVALLSLAIWLVLVFARDGFWLARERDTRPFVDALSVPGEGRAR